MVKLIYKVFIGLLLATTIGLGIATFYAEPQRPEYPTEIYTKADVNALDGEPTAETLRKEKEYNDKSKLYDEQMQTYNRNTALIAIALSLVVLVLSLTILAKVEIFADGLMLGGIFTLVYGIIRSFGTGDEKLIFVVTLVGLVTAMAVGYLKFVRADGSVKSKK